MGAFIGIDLGTTLSVVARIDETGRPNIVYNKDGSNMTPSCVAEKDRNSFEVGEFARRQWGNEPNTAAARFKRDMGTSATYNINGRPFTPTQLSAMVLKKLIADTEAAIGPIGEAVITIPANFAHDAREATMTAAKNAGLNVKYIINEPTAAALFYAFKSGEKLGGIYAVYDLGGGTFDISVIKVNGQDVEVLATNGVAKLGGLDFDLALQKIVQKKYKTLTGDDLLPEDFTRNDAEEEKKALSSRTQITVRVARKIIEIKRDEFEESISSLITQAEMLCEATLDEAGITVDQVQGVFLVGGSTRIPLVTESVRRVFQREPTVTANVDEVVALGAALYAAYKGDKSKLSSAQKTSIGKLKVSESTSKYFGTLSIGRNDHRNEDVVTNSILIHKGQKIPCSVTESFYTRHDGQEAVTCQVTESAAPETDPRFVKVIWKGALKLPAGRPRGQEIRVTFAYDENQIMKCSFVDVATGADTKIDLSMSSAAGTDTDEINKFMVA